MGPLFPRRASILPALVLVSGLAAYALASCSEAPPPTDGRVEGALLASSLGNHIRKSSISREPYRCARFATGLIGPNIEGVSWDAASDSVVVAPTGAMPQLAVVADLAERTANELSALRTSLDEADIDILFSLGGLGADEASIARVLGALSADARFLVLAMPGDREAVGAHRSAVESLARRGRRVLDASRFRFTRLGSLQVATMPGIGKKSHLVAGDEGCLHTPDDIESLNRKLLRLPSLLLSYSPWRQTGRAATDLGVAGVHTGEVMLEPLRDTGAVLGLVHGMLSGSEPSSKGSVRLVAPPQTLAVHASPDSSASALLLTIAGAKLGWKRLPVQ